MLLMDSEYYLVNIRNKLLRLMLPSKMGRTAIAFQLELESFYEAFLNILFDWQLESVNESKNMPGVSLVDSYNKILVYVSTNTSTKKIQECLNRIPSSFHDGYHFYYVAITDKVPKNKKGFTVPLGLSFDPNNDILDVLRILQIVAYTPVEKQKQLSDLCYAYSIPEADERFVDFHIYNKLQDVIKDDIRLDLATIKKMQESEGGEKDTPSNLDAIDPVQTPILFSVCTKKAYDINTEYYNGLHFVWCAPFFNDPLQPPTSNPYSIYTLLQDIILHGDIHAKEITDNKAGLLRGVSAREKQGIITADDRKLINSLIDRDKKTDNYFPVIYVIPVSKLTNYKARCEKQEKEKCASRSSEEYIIKDLKAEEFYLIDFTASLDRMPHTDIMSNIIR